MISTTLCGNMSMEAVLASECNYSRNENKLLERSIINGVVYSLVELPDGERLIAVDLVKRTQGKWSVRNMTERMSPCYYNCPLYILNQSTQMDDDSIEWRAECLRRKNDSKLMPDLILKLRRGMVLKREKFGDVTFAFKHSKSDDHFIGWDEQGNRYKYKYTVFTVEAVQEAIKNGVARVAS